MAYEPVRAEERRQAACGNGFLEALAGESVAKDSGHRSGVVKDRVTGAVTWLRASTSDFDNYKRELESREVEELRETVRNCWARLRSGVW